MTVMPFQAAGSTEPTAAPVLTPMSVSVVVCAYTDQRWDQMLAAMDSLQHQTFAPRELILVIDHNPALLERARAALRGVTVIDNREERGLSGARNSGMAVATGDILAFMDEDAVAAPDWLAQLVSAYSDDQVLGVGGAILPQWEKARPRWFPEEFNWVVGCTYLGMPTSTAPIRNLIGCNMSFRRSVAEAMPGFRSGIGRVGKRPVGCEETEYCIRASQLWPGRRFIYEPQARVLHHVPQERAHWGYFRARCYAEGLSKALIGRYVGTGDSLASESAYTFRTLPVGFFRGLGNGLRGDIGGFGRAAAIFIGLATTTLGYLVGRLHSGNTATTPTTAAAPAAPGQP
jgi:GT2 family glycosyltransferase